MSGLEAFGIAASGAGLLSLSIQLVESAAKLKRIYHAARDAPRIIARLQLGLETMALALRQLEQRRQQSSATDALLARCIVECELHTADIQELVDKMDDRLSKDAKIGGRLYAAFKQRDVKDMLDGLEKAKSSLELSYMIYLGEEQRRRDKTYTEMLALHGSLINGLQVQLSAGNASLSQQLTLLGQSSVLSQQQRPMILSTPTDTTGTAMTSITCGRATDTPGSVVQVIDRAGQCERPLGVRDVERKNNKPRHRATLRFPSWLTSRVFDFAVSQSQGGWSIHLRTFNHVSSESLIFHYCQSGNLEGVRRLIKSRKATPLDAIKGNPSTFGVGGWETLIEVAAFHGRLEVCQYLLSQTTWPDHEERLSNALGWYTFVHSSHYPDSDCQNMYRLFLTDPGFGTYTELDEIRQPLWLEFCRVFENLEIILQYQLPGLTSEPLETRFEMVSWPFWRDAAGFLRFLGVQPSLDPRLASLRNSEGRSVLHCVASNLERNQEWFEIGLTALKSGVDPWSVASRVYGKWWQATPLLEFLEIHDWETLHHEGWIRASHKIQTWAEMIQQAGLDLCEYGARESEVWKALGLQDALTRIRSGGHVVQLVYGPKPADWSLAIAYSWQLELYRLQQPPGAFGFDPRLSLEIAWRPTRDEDEEGTWICVERKQRVTKAVDVRDLVSDPNPFDLVAGSQDDSGAVMLMQHRASRVASGTRMRSHSQPPYLSQRELAHFRGSTFTEMIHFCPLHRRWMLSGARRAPEGPPIPGLELHKPVQDVRRCLKGECSERLSSFQQTPEWRDNSFLATVARCQSRRSYYYPYLTGPGRLGHSFTRDCPQGCGKVDLDRLNVPVLLLPFHPRRRYVVEDEDS